MEGKKIIAICKSGGEFVTNKDGTLCYNGGNSHALDIDDQTTFDDFKIELAEMFFCGVNSMSIKYFLPGIGTKKTLISIANGKDLCRMVKFHVDSSETVDLFVSVERVADRDDSEMLSTRFSTAGWVDHCLDHISESKKKVSNLITDVEIMYEFSHHEKGVARINNGSFGSFPRSVIMAARQWQLKWLQQPDSFYFHELQEGFLESRNVIKRLINADNVDEITVVDNATTAVAIVLQQTAWAFTEGKYQKGDAIVMLHYAYGAVKKAIEAYISRAGGYIIEVQFNFPVNSNNEIVTEFRKALEKGKANGRRVRLALIDHVTSMPSVVIPVKDLVKICRQEGVEQVFVDGAHGIGCVDVDVQEIGADFYTSNLHKWFFCPPSVAFLHCRQLAKRSDLHHPIVSHEYGNGLTMESGWVGTRDYSPLLVVPSTLEFINRFESGIEGIKKRNHEAVVEMGKMLANAWGTSLGSPPDMCASMIMVGLPPRLGISSENDALKFRMHLRKIFGVEVPIFYRSPADEEVESITGYARVSHQVYNKIQDYHRFRDAINELVSVGFACSSLSD